MRMIFTAAALLCLTAAGAHAQTATGASAPDADHGKSVFNRSCSSCHQVSQPKNLIGPNLIGVVGRKIGGVEGYSYSAALKGAEGTWTPALLDGFLANPGQAMKGTKMANRLPNEADRADVIAYLATVK